MVGAYNLKKELIGVCLVKRNINRLYISIVAVKFEYQGKGICKQIFSLIDKLAKEENIKSISLSTMEPALSNIKLYEHLGYKKADFICFKNTNYFSILFYKYFNNNKLRDVFLFFNFNIKKIFIKKIIYKSPQEMTSFGLLLKKIKKFVKKNVFKK